MEEQVAVGEQVQPAAAEQELDVALQLFGMLNALRSFCTSSSSFSESVYGSLGRIVGKCASVSGYVVSWIVIVPFS